MAIILQLAAQVPQPTESFYAIISGFVILAFATVLWFLLRSLIDKVKDIAVVQGEHAVKIGVHDEKHKRHDEDLELHHTELRSIQRQLQRK